MALQTLKKVAPPVKPIASIAKAKAKVEKEEGEKKPRGRQADPEVKEIKLFISNLLLKRKFSDAELAEQTEAAFPGYIEKVPQSMRQHRNLINSGKREKWGIVVGEEYLAPITVDEKGKRTIGQVEPTRGRVEKAEGEEEVEVKAPVAKAAPKPAPKPLAKK